MAGRARRRRGLGASAEGSDRGGGEKTSSHGRDGDGSGARALFRRRHVRSHPQRLCSHTGRARMINRKREIKKILVIKFGALGDFVLPLAAMKRIRDAHPKAKITLLTTSPFEALGRASPYFNFVEADGRPDDFSEWLDMIRRVRRQHFDRIYDLQTSARSNILFHMLWP